MRNVHRAQIQLTINRAFFQQVGKWDWVISESISSLTAGYHGNREALGGRENITTCKYFWLQTKTVTVEFFTC